MGLVICMSSVCHLYVICMSSVCHLYVICMSSVCHLYVICMSSVCHLACSGCHKASAREGWLSSSLIRSSSVLSSPCTYVQAMSVMSVMSGMSIMSVCSRLVSHVSCVICVSCVYQCTMPMCLNNVSCMLKWKRITHTHTHTHIFCASRFYK